MKSDIQSALASVGEVAVFAWSLLELLLTRILPLLGFLAVHLLLQGWSVVASIFFNARGNSYAEEEQQQQQQQQRHGETEAAIEHTLNPYDNILHEEPQLQTSSAPPQDLHLQGAIAAPSAADDFKPSDSQIADLSPSAPPANGEPSEHVHVEYNVPSDAKVMDDSAPQMLQTTVIKKQLQPVVELEVAARADERQVDAQLQMAAIKKQLEPVVETEELIEVAAMADEAVNERQVDESAASGREASASSAPSEILRKSGSKRKSSSSVKRPPFMRVLPPSMSQVKRSLMQRSRRASPSSSSSSSSKPITPNLKRQSPRALRKLASTMKASASYDNFIGKFRKHFLIDSA